MTNAWSQWWSHSASLLTQTMIPRLLLAMLLGSIVGAERQWRQRAAGMRTNTLVCFGAAAFVDLGTRTVGPNTTSIIAYVISGVGFLGAGAIMKEGGSIRGLNTAATLWCSAAVGACAGAGELLDAVFVTGLLLSINVALRPLSRLIDRRSLASSRIGAIYRIVIVCSKSHEQAVGALVMRAIASRPLTLRELRTEDLEGSPDLSLEAVVESIDHDKTIVDKLAVELRADPNVIEVEWAKTSADVD